MFPKIVVPQNGWFKMENPIKMDDLGGKPTIFGNPHMETKQKYKKPGLGGWWFNPREPMGSFLGKWRFSGLIRLQSSGVARLPTVKGLGFDVT